MSSSPYRTRGVGASGTSSPRSTTDRKRAASPRAASPRTAGRQSKKSIGEPPVVRRAVRRVVGLFIDGPSLDRAARRLNRRVDFSALIRGVCPGSAPVVARYYTVIPHDDDSRQRSFLDAVRGAGFDVIVKRLPPKGINRQVAVDPDMAADMLAFAHGHTSFAQSPELHDISLRATPPSEGREEGGVSEDSSRPTEEPDTREIRRCVTVVCPSRELAYALWLSKQVGVETTTADFSKFASGDFMRTATKWMDLSDSETIWVSKD